MCPDKIGWDKYDKAAMGIRGATPESQTVFTYPGWDKLLEDLTLAGKADMLWLRRFEPDYIRTEQGWFLHWILIRLEISKRGS